MNVEEFIEENKDELEEYWNASVNHTNNVHSCLELYTKRIINRYLQDKLITERVCEVQKGKVLSTKQIRNRIFKKDNTHNSKQLGEDKE